MSTSAVRAAMVPISRRVRAFFAPVDRTTETPTVFDPGKYGAFTLSTPPSPWIDLGWIDNFQRSSTMATEALRAGSQGAATGQFRVTLDAQVEFDFREWGKLQMALAGGSEHMNVLAPDPSADARPSGGTPLTAVAVLPGSTANEVIVGEGAVGSFSAGDIIAVDSDYSGATGYVGTAVPGAYVSDPSAVREDVNYTRRVTFNVGRVVELTATSLILAQPLIGGAPSAGMNIQKVIAFVDREGGTFFQEWSALFVAEEESGGRVCFYYPRLSPTTSVARTIRFNTTAGPEQSSMQVFRREEEVKAVGPIVSLALHAAFAALPYNDINDGQNVVCYRSYFPASMAMLY
jgi:hypothetical protein